MTRGFYRRADPDADMPTKNMNNSWLTADGRKRICQFTFCQKKVARYTDAKGDVYYSRYFCKHHSCGLGLFYCGRPKRSAARFCNNHSVCEVPTCTVKMTSADKERIMEHRPMSIYRFCCENHRCQYSERRKLKCCEGAWLQEGSRYCEWHTRMLAEQHEAATWVRQNQCCSPGCVSQRHWVDSWFCQKHKCAHCAELAGADGLCSKHQPQPAMCAALGCNDYSVPQVGAEPGDLCTGHRRCAEYGCSEIISAHMVFCDAHRCRVVSCVSRRCQSLKPNTEYCRLHCCIEEGCIYCVTNCHDERSQRCLAHTCNVEGCHVKSLVDQGYCADHSCRAMGCYNNSLGRHNFCSAHECQEKNCLSLCKEFKAYCPSHGCDQDDCSERNGDPDYPNLCTGHARQKLRRAGLEEGRKEMETEVELERLRSAQLEDYISSSRPTSSGSSSRRHEKSKKHGHDKEKADKRRRERDLEELLRESHREYARQYLREQRNGHRLDPRDYDSGAYPSDSSRSRPESVRYVANPYGWKYTG